MDACADELYLIIQADLKAEVTAGRLIPFGFFGQNRGVECRYPCYSVRSATIQTPYLTRGQRGTSIFFYKEKELDALMKRLKGLGAADDVRMRYLSGEHYDAYTFISALYELR